MTENEKLGDDLPSEISFDAYVTQWESKNAGSMKGFDRTQRRYRFYSKYNRERQLRVESLWMMSDLFRSSNLQLQVPQNWLFITDDWCVDSAYSLPLVRGAAALRDDISLSILLKDDNLTVLDNFLTNGARRIPKFVVLDADSKVQGVWGPQPEAIRLIRKELIDSKAEGSVVSGTTIDWYEKQGWLEVERELSLFFSGLN